MQEQRKTTGGYRSRAILAAAVLAVVPMTAQAIDWYGGIGFGKSENKIGINRLLGRNYTSATVDSEDSSWKIMGGMALWDKYVGAELTYADLGRTTMDGIVSGSAASASTDVQSLTISLVFGIPVSDQLTAQIRLGLSRSESDISVGGSAPTPLTSKTTDFEFLPGFGVQYDFSKTMGARVEWERYTVNNETLSTTSLGLVYRFK